MIDAIDVDRYLRFDRHDWAELRAQTPLTLHERDLEFDLFAVTEFRLRSRDAALTHELDQLLNLWQQNGRLQLLRQRGQELRHAKRPQPQPATVRNE